MYHRPTSRKLMKGENSANKKSNKNWIQGDTGTFII